MGLFEEVVRACETHVQPSYSTEELVNLVKISVPNLKPKTVIPSDYCYNRINLGIDFTKHVFIDIGKRYKYVGRNFAYTGPIFWAEDRKNERIVGVWNSGRFELWEDFPKVSVGNSKRVALESIGPTELETHEANFAEQVRKSLRDSDDDRRERLKVASRIPARITINTQVYIRNWDVVAEVLKRADGRCECCSNAAPFLRRKDGTPYLEVHHKIQLARGGEDTVDNAIALCPNCHRQQHFGV